jgi:CelD/BcsL family acetyltransferase involved in cellulose biosynthesis
VIAALEVRPEPPSAGLDTLWEQLEQTTRCGWFQTRQWIDAWRTTFEPRTEITFLVARDAAGEAAGILPLATLRRRVHRTVPVSLEYVGLAGSGTGAADHLGPIASSDAAGGALFAAARDLAGRRPLLLESVDPEWSSIAREVLDARVVRTVPCPRLSREPQSSFADAWPAKTRKNVRRRDRMLAEEGITERWVGAGVGFVDELRALRALHEARWRAKGGPGLFDDRRLRLLSCFDVADSGSGGARLLVLERGSERVGMLFGFMFRDTFSVYKTGWDPEYARLGIGIALGSAAMRRAEDEGALVFDYLRGAGGHKHGFGAVNRTDVSLVCGLPLGRR